MERPLPLARCLQALLVYLLLADGEGRFEVLTRLMVLFWPAVAVADIFISRRRAGKNDGRRPPRSRHDSSIWHPHPRAFPA